MFNTFNFNISFNNHNIMTSSDHDSKLSKAPSIATNPFSLAAKSAVPSDKPANHTGRGRSFRCFQ